VPWICGTIILRCVAAIGGGAALWTGVMAWRQRRDRLRFHERGVLQTRRGRHRWLFYDDVGVGGWGQSLILEPLPGLGRPTISYLFLTVKDNVDLAGVRDLACRPRALRWAEEIAHGPLRWVRWTEQLRFLSDGLEFTTQAPGREASDA